MEFKGKTLDKFQEDAIAAIDRNHSCVVSASTGTGKTLIAEYIIHKHLPEGNTIIYTAPIKALSNQKFRDFCEDYGEEQVGLLTGDHTIRHEAPILIMTTEIYRNMLLTNDPLLDKISYVIFDEIHYINDIQRGTVWEESIIFSPEHIRFLALSATIPNYQEFADWISHVKGHEVETVFYNNRPVPLNHTVYDTKLGLTTIKDIQTDMLHDEAAQVGVQMSSKTKKKKKKRSPHTLKAPNHLDIVKAVGDKMPAMYFCFSRKKTQDFAVELSKHQDYLSTEDSSKVNTYVRSQMNEEINKMASTKVLRQVLPKGIGFHHSGMLPMHKHIVEHLFGLGLVRVLYTTETFSVGINMPAKTVVFHTLEKYDGISMRMLNAKEYFQIAGRAGRRGLDKEGLVIAGVHRKFTNLERLKKISTVDDEPIISQFTLSTNTVLNLLSNYDEETQERLLKSSFDYYVRTKNNRKVNIMNSFKNKIKALKKLNYIVEGSDHNDGAYVEATQKYELTEKGLFARKIYSNEITLTELFHLTHLHKITNLDLLIILAAITYEERRLDYFMIKGSDKTYSRIMKTLHNTKIVDDINKISLKRMINFVTCWATGGSFTDLMKLSNLAEGDIVRFFRRLIDVLVQLQHATPDDAMRTRLGELVKLLDRDMISADI